MRGIASSATTAAFAVAAAAAATRRETRRFICCSKREARAPRDASLALHGVAPCFFSLRSLLWQVRLMLLLSLLLSAMLMVRCGSKSFCIDNLYSVSLPSLDSIERGEIETSHSSLLFACSYICIVCRKATPAVRQATGAAGTWVTKVLYLSYSLQIQQWWEKYQEHDACQQ